MTGSLFDGLDRGALFSTPTPTYRYWLWRTWDRALPRLGWVMLNPSIADENIDDPTIKKCMKYARRDGCGGIVVTNLFAYRAQNPTNLLAALDAGVDIVGPDNDDHLRKLARSPTVDRIVAAWGATGGRKTWPRREAVEQLFHGEHRDLHALHFTADGQPRHPLYCKDSWTIGPYA